MKEYQNKRVSVEDILTLIAPGSSVYVESGCAEPQFLLKRLILDNTHLCDITVFTTIPLHPYADFGGENGSRFRIHSFFVPPSISGAFACGKTDHIPLSSEMMDPFISQGCIRINTAIIQLSPPDEKGFMSLGVTVHVMKSIIEKADVVIAQINNAMPVTCGDTLIHISEIDYLVEYNEPLLESSHEELDPETLEVGEHVALLVEDGSTIQAGFGRIPDAALRAMKGKKGLSIHSEIITDTVVDLVRSGAIADGEAIVASLCIGTGCLFDHVRTNSAIQMKPLSYTSDPQVILSKSPFVSINGAVEVDLTGQSCVALNEQGAHFGALGHPLFNRVAQLSAGGKAIIALRSTSRDGSVSRIVPEFSDPRVGIITSQADISYVVTEYGHVNLFGKSIRERALALITIAHPKFRRWLLEEAKKLNYIYQDQLLPPEDSPYPAHYEQTCIFGGKRFFIRPVKITDERGVQNLFYAMSSDEKFHRFLMNLKALHHRQAQKMVNVDYRTSLGVVVENSDGRSTEIIAIAHIALDDGECSINTCEFAAMVHPAWQNRGIGSFLLKTMTGIAPQMGFTCMRAYVWEENTKMLKVFEKLRLPARIELEYHVVKLDLDLGPVGEQFESEAGSMLTGDRIVSGYPENGLVLTQGRRNFLPWKV